MNFMRRHSIFIASTVFIGSLFIFFFSLDSRGAISTGAVAGAPASEGTSDLKRIYSYILEYRRSNDGRYPKSMSEIVALIRKGAKSKESAMTLLTELSNTEMQNGLSKQSQRERLVIPYVVTDVRPDGSPIGSAKTANTRDVLASTNIYVHDRLETSRGKDFVNAGGYYLVLWDDGNVEAVPFDQIIYVVDGERSYTAYYGQAGVPADRSLSYEQFWTHDSTQVLPIGKPIPEGMDGPIKDNGGPDSLMALSHLLSAPIVTSPYLQFGIGREKMWQVFDPTQPQFMLADVAEGSAKLGLLLQQKKLTLPELKKLNSPAILYLSDAARIVTLANIDDQQAIVLDQGRSRIVSREVLAKPYSGEALLPASATTASQVLIDDPIRVLSLKSRDEDIKQQIKITNHGKKPLTLQIERPIPGVTQADLSSDTLAPGASATLSLSIKWRSVLKGDTQNVFVFLRTNDPVRPRIQLGFQLNAPKAEAAPSEPATAPAPAAASPAP